MVERTWILVCDSGRARIFVNHGAREGVREVEDEEQGLPKVTDLVTGKRGRNKPGDRFLMRHAYEPPTDPRKREKEEFVRHVAHMLNEREQEFTRLIIAAPPAALHVLRGEISLAVRKKMIGEINKDLTKETVATLPQYLKPFMPVYDPLHDYTQDRAAGFGVS